MFGIKIDVFIKTKLMKPQQLLMLFLLVLLGACASNNYSKQEIYNLKNAVSSKEFELNFESANPYSSSSLNAINTLLPVGRRSGNISIIGNINYFKIIRDSLSIDLQYFGERHLVEHYNEKDNTINFKGKFNKEELQYNTKKKAYELKFWFKNNQESCWVNLTLFPNKKAFMILNSNARSGISYTGVWNTLDFND